MSGADPINDAEPFCACLKPASEHGVCGQDYCSKFGLAIDCTHECDQEGTYGED